ncbi:scavenger receptor class F member 1-like [Haliotis rubra]|uniref:scavenger receptor class F member 1-like n=1 Tax=Haliotis rubra TaxID=36100 RepID=UPI001EE5C8E3|nr:scavenger receptor class F member 1-like [Haliotis rubra]
MVQPYLCPDPRFFGTDCDKNCSDACVNSRCELQETTLVCTDGCIDGKKGIYCQEDCLSTCSKCERYGIVCLQCREALSYGKKCDKRCPPNCKGGCAKETGICTTCASGFKGAKCETPCRPGCEVCPRYTDGCFTCLSDRYYGKDCRFPCPQNCLQCKKDTGDCSECVHGYSGKQCTEHVQKLDPNTILITCSVLGVVLFGGVLLFLHRLCTNRHQRRPETNPPTGSQNTSTMDVRARHGTLNHESRDYDVPHKYWEIHDTDLDTVTQSTASVQTGDMDGASNTMRYHPKPDIPKETM